MEKSLFKKTFDRNNYRFSIFSENEYTFCCMSEETVKKEAIFDFLDSLS